MQILTRTHGQEDNWQQKLKMRTTHCLLVGNDPLDRKQEQKMTLEAE